MYLGLHEGNLLHFALENQKAIVVQIDAALFEKSGHFTRCAAFVVYKVFACVVLVGNTTHYDQRIGYYFVTRN